MSESLLNWLFIFGLVAVFGGWTFLFSKMLSRDK